MISFFALSTILFALPTVLTTPLYEQLPDIPAGWSTLRIPDAGQLVTLKIVLKQRNLDQLESRLAAVSDPLSPSYGRYYTADEVRGVFAVPDSSMNAVSSWAKDLALVYSVDEHRHITIRTNVSNANTLFGASFKQYSHNSTGTKKLRTLQYAIPDEISEHVDFVTPTTFFGSPTMPRPNLKKSVAVPDMRRSTKPVNKTRNCFKAEDDDEPYPGPDCWKSLWNITYTADASSGSRIGFGSFLNQSAIASDLALFEEQYGVPKQNISVQLINGGINHQEDAYFLISEANLDAQNIVGLANPLPVTEFITGGLAPFVPDLISPTPADNQNEPYLEYYDYLLAQSNDEIPQVISNSYGEDEQTVPQRYATKVCNMIGMLGLRGISVLQSSGDTGVGASCQSNDGRRIPQFTPMFPGSCPYLTSVGGTQSVYPEIAWTASSGGFSNYLGRPWYQERAIDVFLHDHLTEEARDINTRYANISGRGYPDIAAHSSDPFWPVYIQGTLTLLSGTSAACPAWAAMIGLLNDARFKAGQPAIGFANPLFYSLRSGFRDVTEGGATGCTGFNSQTGLKIEGASIIPFASWNASIGWDPATGLGLPDFGLLLETLGLNNNATSE